MCFQHVGELAYLGYRINEEKKYSSYLLQQLVIRDLANVVRFVTLTDESDLRTLAIEYVPVNAVVADVEPAIEEPSNVTLLE